jgi:DNA-binding NtrC family response regulator
LWRNGKFGILVVDDEPAVLATYELILKKRDFAVHVAESSSRAIQLLGEYTYDLLLCDYSLEQEHTGFEVIHAARRVHPDIAAVLLTGYASKETVDRAQADNVTVLFKPIDIEEFFRTVESLKRGKDAQASQQKTDQGKRQERKRPKGKARAAANRRGDSN